MFSVLFALLSPLVRPVYGPLWCSGYPPRRACRCGGLPPPPPSPLTPPPHVLIPESPWSLPSPPPPPRLYPFYSLLTRRLSSFISGLPEGSWKGCLALGDWNMVEPPSDHAPHRAPNSRFRSVLRIFS